MESAADALGKLISLVATVGGPAAHGFIADFMQNVDPSNISCRSSVYFDCLSKALYEDSRVFAELGNVRRAFQCRSCALQAHDIYFNFTLSSYLSDTDLVTIHLTLAQDSEALNNFEAAIENCNKCIELAPELDEPYKIAARLKGVQKEHGAAALYFFRMLRDTDCNMLDLMFKLGNLAVCLAQVSDPADIKMLRPFSHSRPFCNLKLDQWLPILEILYKKDSYAALALLTTGNCGVTFEPPTYLHKLADIPGMRYQWLDTGQMFKHFKGEDGGIKGWHLRLADFVVKRGADVLQISQAFSQPLLVVMTTLSVEGEVPSFLDLAWSRLTCQEYDNSDHQNNTPLHAFVKSPKWKTSKMAEVTLKALLAKGCLATEKDLRGKMPHEYVPDTHPFHKLLSNAAKTPEDGLLKRLEEIRKVGNEALKSKDLRLALEGYTLATSIAEKFPRSVNALKAEKAVLYSNMAAVHLMQNQPQEALETAEKSLRNDAGFVKSYLRQGQAFSKLKKYGQACISFKRGFEVTSNPDEKVKFCMEAVNQISKLTGEQARQTLIDLKSMLVIVWPEVLKRLTSEGSWSEVNTLVCGPPKFTLGLGIMSEYLCKTANLNTIFDFSIKGRFDFGFLMTVLVERSANFSSLAVSEHDTAFHALVRLFVREIVNLQYLDGILEALHSSNQWNDGKLPADGEGRSLLHTVCMESQSQPDTVYVAECFVALLSHSSKHGWGLGLTLTDKHNKRPVDYCKPGSRLQAYVKSFVAAASGSKRPPSPASYYRSKSKSPSESGRTGNSGANSFPGPSTNDMGKSWQDLKAEAGRAYSGGNYKQALELYKQAITALRRDLLNAGRDLHYLPESSSRDLAVLYGNCGECHFKLKNYPAFFEYAKQNVDFDGLWFKGHFRVGRACTLLNQPKLAVQAFVNSYNHLTPAEVAQIDTPQLILSNLAEAASHFKSSLEQASERELGLLLSNLSPVASDVRIRCALHFIKENGGLQSWKKAEFVFALAGETVPHPQKEDLSLFCKKEFLCRQGWVCSIILHLLKSKSDVRTLKFHPGDHYLHAVIALVVISGSSPTKHPNAAVLLEKVVQFAKGQGELNRQDADGNTGLHLLVQCKGPCEPMRVKAANLLIESGMDVLMKRKDGRIAVEVMAVSDSVKGVLQSATDIAIAIEKCKSPAKGSTGKPRDRSHSTPQADLREPNQSRKGNSQSAQQTKLPKQHNAPHSANSRSSEHHGKDAAAAAKKMECDECERLLRGAKTWTGQKLDPIYKDLVKVIKSNHRQDNRHGKLRNESIKLISRRLLQKDVPDIPDCLTDLKAVDFRELVHMAAEAKRWMHLMSLVFKFKEQKGRDALSRFAENLRLDEVIESTEITEANKEELVKLLATHGAEKGIALESAVEQGCWKIAMTLLDLGASPANLTLADGDTPLHAAVTIALEKDPGNMDFLKKLKQLMDKNSGAHPSLQLSCQDGNGNSLMHLATKCKSSPYAAAVVDLLWSWNCPVDLPDHAGQKPVDYLKRNDRRAQYLRSASTGSKQETAVLAEEIDTDSNVIKLRQEVEKRLFSLPDVIVNFLDEESQHLEEEQVKEEEEDEEEEEEDAEDNDKQIYTVSEVDEEGESKQEEDVAIDDLDLDAHMFDNLPWDVECTEAVWNLLKDGSKASEKDRNTLRKERISDQMKRIVVIKIRQLASGSWPPHLQRKIHGTPHTLALYCVYLPGGAAILWELAVAFCPDRSHKTAGFQADGDKYQNVAGGGKIYSEIIRVWSIVQNSSELQRKVKWIVGSHRRGKDCLVQKQLRGLPSSEFTCDSDSVRHPGLYMELELTAPKSKDLAANRQLSLAPPASARRNEFQILKFYLFSSPLVAAILSNSTKKIDFPFRVTDLEFEMIHLESKSSVLLLGRSGTGKTTCCLYRLWATFLHYWERAKEIGDAWLPQHNPALDILDNDEGDEDDEEETPQASNVNGESTPSHVETEDSRDNAFNEIDSDEEMHDDTDEGSESNEDPDAEEEQDEQQRSGPPKEIFAHLHQLFVTKNPKLCSEVERNFLKLRHASRALQEHNSAEKEPLPNSLQDVEDMAFPLFLTSRQLLLLLDASVEGTPFFARDEDLNLKYSIPGWGTQEDIFAMDPLDPNDWLNSDDDDDNDDDDDSHRGAAASKGASVRGGQEESHHQFGRQRKLKTYLRRECTFDVFVSEVWPKIAKKAKVDCHPSLVWTEIMSFIQGSYEALSSNSGHLNLQDYLVLGRRRAPNFSGDRSKVYTAFELYRKFKQDHHLFDEADFVYNIYKRLRQMKYYQPWILHEVYVDETQDFSQAELTLLICICQDPNKMFLAGDTAQAIMRGISFRFIDLTSLFHYAAKSVDPHLKGQHSIIKVPDKVHQLRYNYRSHNGILSLASSVLDILQNFFPESFDRMHRDQGMFPGPKPVLIESCSSEDLALLLCGNERVSSHIEFGAHQAILVTSEESKALLPEVLTAGLVLTIYEAKGLEFDDVLLYNFFADSQALKEWRVVTEFLDQLASESAGHDGSSLVEIDAGILESANRPRPLTFDPDQHKILNSELKHLYTAVTRARVNVWIFDRDPQCRGPMFEYFKARKLVQCVKLKEEPLSENFIFAQKSSIQQWRKTGEKFMSQKQFALAVKCFRHAGYQSGEKLAQAYQSATEASALRSKPHEMRREYLKAGAQFVSCDDLHRAALCFRNAKEYRLAALAFEKHGELEPASTQYQLVSSPNEASRCLEQAGMFRRAIAVLEDSHQYDRAIDCLHRYQIKVERVKAEREVIPKVLVDNRPKESQSKDDLCHRAANYHHQKKDFGKAEAAIIRLKNPSDQIVFLERNGYWKKAAEILREEGNTEKAAALMLKSGNLERAVGIAKDGFHKPLEASIYLALARQNYPKEGSDQNEEKALLCAETALSKYTELENFEGQAQAKLFMGQVKKNWKLLRDAGDLFIFDAKPRNYLGEVEAFHRRFQLADKDTVVEKFRDLPKKIQSGVKAVKHIVLNKLEGLAASFYGLELQEDASGQKVVSWHPLSFPRCSEILDQIKDKELQEPGRGYTVPIDKAVTTLAQHVLDCVAGWARQYQECLRKCLELKPRDKSSAGKYLDLLLRDATIDYCLQTGWEQIQGWGSKSQPLPLTFDISMEERWRSAQRLMDFLVPDSIPPWRSSGQDTRSLVTRVCSSKDAVQQILRCLRHEWNNQGRVGRGRSDNRLKERCKSTDWVVRAGLFSSLLLTWDRLDVEREVEEMETELNKNFDYYQEWTKKKFKFALFDCNVVNEIEKKYIIEYMGSKFTDSLYHLICKQDCVSALFDFSKMLTVLGKRAVTSLMPHHKHLVFWLEVFLSIAWFFIGKGKSPKKGECFYMSTTLFSSVEIVNACILGHSKENWTIQKMATGREIGYRAAERLNYREDYLIHFLVGDSQYSNFSLLSQVAGLCGGDKEGEVNPLAERIIFLSLLALLNIPSNFVHYSNERLIRREFAKLSKCEDLPQDLKVLVREVHKAETYDTVATAMTDYLARRSQTASEQPFLCRCEWVGRPECPMKWTELQPDDYLRGVTFKTSASAPDSSQETRVSEEETVQEKLEEQRKMQAKLEKLKEMPAGDRGAGESSLERAAPGHVDQFLTEVDKLFQQYTQVTETECELCDEDFSARAELEAERGAPGVEIRTSDAVEDTDSSPTHSLPRETNADPRSKHLQSPGHIKRQQQVDAFKKIYSREIHPKLEDIKSFLSNAKARPASSNLWISKMIFRIEEAVKKFEESRSSLLSRKSWTKIDQLRVEFHPVAAAFSDRAAIDRQIEEQEKREKEEQDHRERMEDGLGEVADVDPNDQPLPAKNKVRGHQGGAARKSGGNRPPRSQRQHNNSH